MLPIVSQEVCETIVHELEDQAIYSDIGKGQEALQWQWAHAYHEISILLSKEAGEAALRLAMLTYKALESQLEVNALED